MADDETQGSELTSWWASDALDDSSLPPTTFDEPLVWPESPSWGDPEGAETVGGGFDALLGQQGDDAGLLFPSPAVPGDGPESDAQWRPSEEPLDPDAVDADATVHHSEPLAGLGGGVRARTVPNVSDDLPWPAPVGSTTPDPHTDMPRPPELGSIWSNDFRSDPENLPGFADLPPPAIYADTERSGGGLRWRGFDVRTGNAAVIGLISVVSLVLLGMFLSVRARNDTPTDTSQGKPADEISVARPLNTVPLTTTATSTTTTQVPAINIAELLPPTETTGDAGTSGAGGSTGTTAAPRAATPTGGGAATTAPAAQPAATSPPATRPPATAPPATDPPVTSPPATSPPATSPPDDTTPTTRRPLPTTPTVPSFTVPTFTIPGFPGLPDRD